MTSTQAVQLEAEVTWGAGGAGTLTLEQDARAVKFSGMHLTTVLRDNFDTSQKIYIHAVSADGKSSKKALLSCAVFSITVFGNYVPIVLNAEAYFSTRQSFGEEYINTLSDIMSHTWLLPLLVVSCFVCGFIGGMIGKALLKKHFVKAGIA